MKKLADERELIKQQELKQAQIQINQPQEVAPVNSEVVRESTSAGGKLL